MKFAQKLAAAGLCVALLAAGYGVFALRQPSTVSAKKNLATQTLLVDQTPLKTAQQLAQLADMPDEQELAKNALRLGDYELDLSFNIALQEAEAHPPVLSRQALEVQSRLQKQQKLQQALQAQVDQLKVELAKASGVKKDTLQDQLDLASASLDVASNDVDDATRDLTDAGGNLHDRIEQMKQQHAEADNASNGIAQKFPAPTEDHFGMVHWVQRWLSLSSKKKLLRQGRTDADNLVAALTKQHADLSAQIELEKIKSPHLAAHSQLAGAAAPTTANDVAASVKASVRQVRSAGESQDALKSTRAISADQRNQGNFDKRIDNQKELSQT